MGLLDKFHVYGKKRTGKIFISITSYGLTFSKSCIDSLSYADYVHVLFEDDGVRMAVAPCNKDAEARTFVRDRNSPRAGFVRWTDRQLINYIIDLGGIEMGSKGVRIDGDYLASDNVLLFDLRNYTPLKGKSDAKT